jgi:hypothetical protein
MDQADSVGAIYCDSAFDLVNKSEGMFQGLTKLLRREIDLSTIMPGVAQSLHNRISKTKHEGLHELHFVKAGQSWIVQLCKVLSDFLLSSVRYQFSAHGNVEKDRNGMAKHLLIQNYFDLEGIPLKHLKLRYNSLIGDIEPEEETGISVRLG